MKPRVSLATLLAMPWRTAHASLRWLMLVLMVGSLVVALALDIHFPKPGFHHFGVLACFVSVGISWLLWFPANVLLAQDAHRLRVPAVETAAVRSLLLYGLICVAVPTLLLGTGGADVTLTALCMALAVCGGLAYALLPRRVALPFCFLPLLAGGLHDRGLLPPLHDPRWPQWGALALLVLLTVAAWRWRKLVRDTSDHNLGFGSAVVMMHRRQSTRSDWTGVPDAGSAQLIRQLPDWMQPQAVVRNAGPRAPVQALRIALGGIYLPKTLGSRLRALIPSAFFLLMMPALLSFQDGKGLFGNPATWLADALIFFGGIVFTSALVLDMVVPSQAGQRWRRVNAELPLLALLPGLDDPSMQRDHLLRTLFGGPLRVQAVLLAATLVAAWLLHLRGPMLVLLALTLAVGAGAMLAQTLCTLGNDPLPVWRGWLYSLALLGLVLASLVMVAIALVTRMTLATAWLVRRGWQAFNARPHPFLPIA